MSKRSLGPILAAMFLAAPLAVARADEAPSPDSPNAHCSVEEQCPHGVLCAYSFKPGAPDTPESQIQKAKELDCVDAAKKKGMELRCRHGGNYAGQHLYCPKGESGSWGGSTKGCGK